MSVVLSLLAACAVACNLIAPSEAGESASLTAEEFGAVADDEIDDTAALQAALDALSPGGVLVLRAGTYRHGDVLAVRVPGVRIEGAARLLATTEERSAFHIAAPGIVVDGIAFGVASTTRRWFAFEQMKIRVSADDTVLRDVVVEGSAAAGIHIGEGAGGFTVERASVSNTRADGIHVTGAAHDGVIDRATTAATGDDGVAVVSYATDPGPCRNIAVRSPTVLGTTWGRGISVVGGENVVYTDITVQDTDSAGVYVAVEPDPYFTRSVREVRVIGGTVERANRNAGIDHGSVLVYLGRADHEIVDVRIEGLQITGTRRSASSDVTVRSDGVPPRFLTFADLEIEDGPATRYGGNVPAEFYSVSG